MSEDVTIQHLGAQGDGVAETEQGRLFVPGAAPGDVYRIVETVAAGADRRAVAAELVTPSADRVTPPCPYFGRCGGCSLQHVAPRRIASFKRDRLIQALAHRGIDDVDVAPTLTAPAGTRRRARFACQRTAKGWIVGFNAAGSKTIVPLNGCHVLDPALAALPTLLTELLPRLPSFGARGDIQATAGASGLEICFHPAKASDLALEERYLLADWAEERDLARIAWESGTGLEPVAARRAFTVAAGGAILLPPAGAFLQASPAGEEAILSLVKDAVRGSQRIADLYAGCGTLSLPLALAGHRVHAVEIATDMTAAIHTASGGQVSTETRNLARRPLTAEEFSAFDGVIFDPPRAGAKEQAQELAQSQVPVAVAVSCNVATLARDLRILLDGGYRLEAATPIDQFTWTAHLEAVAVLRRPD